VTFAARRRILVVTAAAVVLGAVFVFTRRPASEPAHADVPASAPSVAAPLADPPPTAASAPPAEPPVTASVHPAAPAASATFDEPELMRELRSASGNDPALAIDLAREGNRRFPGSPDAPERTSILIHALSDQGLKSEARGTAEDMVNRYPDSRWVQEIERFTGAHRHRNVRVDEQGKLRFYDPPPS
jgi:hypothetical protein